MGRQTRRNFSLVLVLFVTYLFGVAEANQNLSCYQCTRTTHTECKPEELLPCPSSSDRCVTHIMKNEKDGFVLKRECGLGPCSFQDQMANKGLGLDSVCDRSKDDYFCIFCCKESGCNKSHATSINQPSLTGSIAAVITLRVMFNYYYT